MRKMRTITFIALLTVMLAGYALPIGAQGGSDELPAYTGGPAELRMGWWGNDDRAARTLGVIDLFEAAYPEITVIGEPNGGAGDHFQILDTQLAANNAPDIIQFGGNWPDYQQYLEPLNGYLGQQLLIDTPERFDQTALIPATASDDNLYAVSLGTNTLVLAYNKTMIEAAGVELPADNMTWEELHDYGRELQAALPEGVAAFVDNSTNQANYLSYFFRQQGTPIWTSDEGGKSYATVESAAAWLQMWADMRAEGLIPDAETTATYNENGPDSSALVAGVAAIGLIWSNQGAAYQAAMTDEIGMTTLPAGGEDAYAIQMSQYLGINKDSENKEAAALFVNFFVNSPEAGAILETNRGVPSSPVVRQAISGQSTPTDAAVYRIYDAVANRSIPQDPNLPNDQEFVNELELIGQQVAFGQSSVEQAAEDLIALIERLAVK
jgi:multiple sugar transport system substrate-binding protein